MSREWRFYLQDLIVFCERVLEYTDQLSRERFEADRRTYDATLRNLEMIGEAARRIPDDIRRRYPSIPWNEIIATRNIFAHVYFGVDNDIVWNIIESEIKPLLAVLKRIDVEWKQEQ